MLSSNGGAEFLQKRSFHTKSDDDKLLSRESSMANPSFRVYYGDLSGAVPFTWETRPGTPKHSAAFSHDSTLPPLTPPPSYSPHTASIPSKKKRPTPKLLRNLLMRLNLKKAYLTASPSSPSSLSSLSRSSSYSSSFSAALTASSVHGRRRFSSCGSSSLDDVGDEHLRAPKESPKSRFCFQVRRNWSSGMKKNLLSMVGCGSG